MRCRQLRKKFARLAGVAVVAGLLWLLATTSHTYGPSPESRGEQSSLHVPDKHQVSDDVKKSLHRPRRYPAKKLFVEQGVTCASGGNPTEGRIFHLAAGNVTADACVERCRVEDACTIFTWVFAAGGDGSVGSCWYRIGGRTGTWPARHAATNAISGCSVDAVIGCDAAQPYNLKEVLRAKDLAQASDAGSDAAAHPACPEPFRKRWTAGSTALMLELLDQLHGELEALRSDPTGTVPLPQSLPHTNLISRCGAGCRTRCLERRCLAKCATAVSSRGKSAKHRSPSVTQMSGLCDTTSSRALLPNQPVQVTCALKRKGKGRGP